MVYKKGKYCKRPLIVLGEQFTVYTYNLPTAEPIFGDSTEIYSGEIYNLNLATSFYCLFQSFSEPIIIKIMIAEKKIFPIRL